MSRNSPLLVGQQITTATGAAVGRIGVVARDHAGRVIALTARHVILAEGIGTIQDAEHSIDLGQTVKLPDYAPTPEELSPLGLPPPAPFFTTIGTFLVGDGIDLAAARLVPATGVHTELDGLVGAPLVGQRPGLPPVRAVVVGVGGVVRFNDPYTNRTTVLSQVVEIQIVGEEALRRGEAGLLFTDEFGSAVGLLMAAEPPRTAYLAPLGPFLAIHGLSLISELAPKTVPDDQEDMARALLVAQLDRAAQANAMIRKALEAEPNMHHDPAATQIPARLLEHLD